VPILRGHFVYVIIDGTIKPPPQTNEVMSTTDEVETVKKKMNPKYATWNLQDQLILGALTSFLTESILTYVLKCTTSMIFGSLLNACSPLTPSLGLCKFISNLLLSRRVIPLSLIIFSNSPALWILLLPLINHSMILSLLHFSLLILG
jgi:hypothetical protein